MFMRMTRRSCARTFSLTWRVICSNPEHRLLSLAKVLASYAAPAVATDVADAAADVAADVAGAEEPAWSESNVFRRLRKRRGYLQILCTG
jgi:hypothetical protein